MSNSEGIVPSLNGIKANWAKAATCESNWCVEAAPTDSGTVLMRDSKDPDGPGFEFDADHWARFTADVRAGMFDFDEVEDISDLCQLVDFIPAEEDDTEHSW